MTHGMDLDGVAPTANACRWRRNSAFGSTDRALQGGTVVESPDRCAFCQKPFDRPREGRKCCSGRRRAAKSRQKVAERDRRLRYLLEAALRLLHEQDR